MKAKPREASENFAIDDKQGGDDVRVQRGGGRIN